MTAESSHLAIISVFVPSTINHSRPLDDKSFSSTVPRRRRRSKRGSREGDYESTRVRDVHQLRSLSNRRLIIHSDKDLSSIADCTKHMYRRKRNSSCQESRDLRMHGAQRDDERTSSFVLHFHEEFGSMETVVGVISIELLSRRLKRTGDRISSSKIVIATC